MVDQGQMRLRHVKSLVHVLVSGKLLTGILKSALAKCKLLGSIIIHDASRSADLIHKAFAERGSSKLLQNSMSVRVRRMLSLMNSGAPRKDIKWRAGSTKHACAQCVLVADHFDSWY